MDAEIAARKAELKERDGIMGQDIFSRLVSANESSGGLSDTELIGNTFLMLFAGHGTRLAIGSSYLWTDLLVWVDTTANTVSATIGLLAVYQEEQEVIYQHIQSTLPESREPVRIRVVI
jgi:cytochrome P450